MNAVLAGLPRSTRLYEAAVEGLARVNEQLYRAHPDWPRVTSPAAAVCYEREPGEVWRHVGDVLREGWGDCEDLAAAEVGWLRAHGERDAKVAIIRTGRRMTHAVVKRGAKGRGKTEDPSRKLGMNRTVTVQASPASSASLRAGLESARLVTTTPPQPSTVTTTPPPPDASYDDAPPYASPYGDGDDVPPYEDPGVIDVDAEVIDEDPDADWDEVGADPSPSADVSWTLERTPSGWRGTIRVPLDLGRCLLVSRVADKKPAALKTATSAASKVLDNPAVAALIPPQARFALNLARSPTARKMASSILKLF